MEFQKPRQIAFQVLRRGESGRSYVETRLDHEFARSPLPARDRALIQELVYGVVRWQGTLDWLISERTEGRRQKPEVQILLRLGLYQMLWLDRVPDHAAVFEMVELAREAGYANESGFINAILRAYARNKGPTRQRLEELKRTDPAAGWSHPAWLVDRWTRRWGLAATVRLLEWNNTPAPTFARLNTLRVRAGTVIEHWRLKERVEYDFGRWDWVPENTVFELKSHPPLDQLGSFQKGWFYVQDPSTLLAVHLLDPQPGEAMLDLCAAPGGKTTYLAQRVEDDCQIQAQDISEERLEMIRRNCERLGVGSVETRLAPADASESLPPGGTRFDRVLVDAPCSNTGALRRRLDLRWRIRPEELDRLRTLQTALLERAARQLKPGGVLVYSTCSLEPEENEEVARAFLARHPDFRLETERQLTPFADGVDGAYAAKLVGGPPPEPGPAKAGA